MATAITVRALEPDDLAAVVAIDQKLMGQLEALGLKPEARRKVIRDNAREVFRL